MIMLYSGTPGAGKSLHLAQVIYWRLKAHKEIVSNFDINMDCVKGDKLGDYVVMDNLNLTPDALIRYSVDLRERKGRRLKEGEILLIIDECQILFNSRDWGQRNRNAWLSFFTQHRKFGYDIILVAQFDRMIDRQIRSLIEYQYIHRRISNCGTIGKLLSLLLLGQPVFCCVKVWYPMKEKVGSEFFRVKKRYYRLYDTYTMFATPD